MLIQTEKYNKEGMYLIFPNGKTVDLSKERVCLLAERYWSDDNKIPVSLRQNAAFKTCSVCPYRGQDVLCSALKPVLPFLETMEEFLSYTKVTVIYVDECMVIHIAESTLQEALRYITNMSLFDFCEDTKQYKRYFKGIVPFVSIEEAISRLYLNIYWAHGGNEAKITEAIREVREAVTITSKSCVKRLSLMCQSDAFKNSYVGLDALVRSITVNIDQILDRYFDFSPQSH